MLRLIAEIRVAIAVLDLTGVFAVRRWTFKVLPGTRWIGNRKLGGHVLADHGGNVRWVTEEGAEEPNRAEL